MRSRITYTCFSIIFLIILFISCKKNNEENKNNPPAATPACYEKFVATYKVLNTDSGSNYTMSITHAQRLNTFGNFYDVLVINNFANIFNLEMTFYCSSDSNNLGDFLNIGSHDSLEDFRGHHWYIFPIFQDSLGNPYCKLSNDTIKFYFEMCNINYYIYESQPYFCKNVLHIAVKQR